MFYEDILTRQNITTYTIIGEDFNGKPGISTAESNVIPIELGTRYERGEVHSL